MGDQQWGQKSRINGYAASGATTPLETTVLDMLGFESVMFIGISSATSTAQHVAMVAGTASATGAGNFSETTGEVVHSVSGAVVGDWFRPAKRFVQGRFTASGATGAARAIVAIRYGARSEPTTQDAPTVVNSFYSPGSGTATG